MTTIHDRTGYLIRPRRRPRDSATMKPTTKTIFELPPPRDEVISKEACRRFFVSKLALPVTQPVDDYNYNMNGVDRADQLRAEMEISLPTVRSWLPYFFWMLDSVVCNAYLLWRWE